MHTFASVLADIVQRRNLPQGALAQRAGIDPGYLSHLRRGTRGQPSEKVLRGLIGALRTFQVSDEELRQLVATTEHNWAPFEHAVPATPAGDEPLLTAILRGIGTKGISLRPEPPQEQQRARQRLGELAFIAGDQRVLFEKAMQLLEHAKNVSVTASQEVRSIFLTWCHNSPPGTSEYENRLINVLRDLLAWRNEHWQVYHLWSGDLTQAVSIVTESLSLYFGTSHYRLLAVPGGAILPPCVVVEGIGGVVGIPDLDLDPARTQHYSLCSFLSTEFPKARASSTARQLSQRKDLSALLQYLQTYFTWLVQSLTRDGHNPILRTVVAQRFAAEDLQELVPEEQRNTTGERLFVAPRFSAVYRPLDALQAWFAQPGEQTTQASAPYLKRHAERVIALKERQTSGKERSIHPRKALQQEFAYLAENLAAGARDDFDRQHEADVMTGQLLNVITTMTTVPNFSFGLGEEEFPTICELIGDKAFFQREHDVAGTPKQSSIPTVLADEKLVADAWIDHRALVDQLRREFHACWKNIPARWRTDNEVGRHQVVHWVVTEVLKALLRAEIPTEAFSSFLRALVPLASQGKKALYEKLMEAEHVAKSIVIVNAELPLFTVPFKAGDWELHVKTRQVLFPAILQDKLSKYHLIVSRDAVERYARECTYGMARQPFKRSLVDEHIRHTCQLLEEHQQKIVIDAIPKEPFTVNFEVVDTASIFIEAADKSSEGGMVLQDQELAQALLRFAQRLAAKYPDEVISGPSNVIRWLKGLLSSEPRPSYPLISSPPSTA